jgi:glucose-6-phosphate 1-epimerase
MPVEMLTNLGKMPMAMLQHRESGASVFIHLQGAHVNGWKTGDGASPLYTSSQTVWAEGKAIRGGVPICWPQFSDFGPCSTAHGFARTSMWDVVDHADSAEEASITLKLKPSPSAPSPFNELTLSYQVTLLGSDGLRLSLSVENPTADAVSFTTALHTYFTVQDINSVRIEGALDLAPYADSLENRAAKDPAPINSIDREVDRIYKGVNGKEVRIVDGLTGAVTAITAVGLNDTVLWNPWIEKAKKMADMPDEDYRKFVCVESCAVYDKATVAAKSTWCGSQTIRHTSGTATSKI